MDDQNLVRIMETLGLNYNPAINATKAFENRIASLNKQLLEMKALAMQGAKDINTTFSSTLGTMGGNKTILDQFGQPLKTIQTEATKAGSGISKSFKPATEELKNHKKTIEEVGKQYDIFGNEMQRRVGWFLSGSLFYGSIKAAKEAVQSISEVEMGMVEIARVMEDSTFVFENYRDELLQLGVDYGQSFDNVQQIALRWAQSGYNVADSLELTKTSLLALNTAELDSKTATESMIGIMAQWQLQAGDLALVMDKVNLTADNYSVTSDDLVNGLLRSSGAAKNMNMTLDETISLLTVMREASGRTGAEVGNALNSILSYISRPGSIKTFESLGIEMFTDNAKTQFRNAMDIFKDIATSWGSLSMEIQDGFIASADDAGLFNEELSTALGLQEEWNDLQQRDISQAAAGVYRRNYFIGMIERMSEAQGVLNNMTGAAGYSIRENEKTMDALEKKYQSLKTAAMQLAVALGDAGLLDTLKGIVDLGTDAAGAISRLNPGMKALLTTSLEIIAISAALKGAMGLFTDKNLLIGAGALLPGWTKLLVIIPAVIGGLALLSKNYSNVAGGIVELQRKQDDLMDSYNSQMEAADKTQTSLLGEAKAAEVLADKLEELSKKEKLNTSEKAQMKSIVDQLNSVMPNLNLQIDQQTGKIIGNTSVIRDNIQALKDQAIAQGWQAKASATGTAYVEQEILLSDTQNVLDRARADLDEMQSSYDNAVKEANKIREDSTKKGTLGVGTAAAITDIYRKYGFGIDPAADMANQTKFIKDTTQLIKEQSGRLSELDAELENYTSKASETGASSPSPAPGDDLVIIYKGGEIKYVKQSEVSKYLQQGWSTTPPSSGGGGGTYSNPALDNALKILDHKKRTNQMSVEDEIATLNAIQSKHVKTADERMNIIERLYDAEQRLISENEKAQKEAADAQKKLRDELLQNSLNWISKEKTFNRLSVQEEIAAWNRVKEKQISNIEAVEKATVELHKLRRKLSEEFIDLLQHDLKDAYDLQIKSIEDTAKAKKKAQKDIISDIEEELKLLDQLESNYDYGKTMEKLREDEAYWSVRTGETARKNLADVRERIAEAEHDRTLELARQALNDKKRIADDEIKKIEETADKEVEKWKLAYENIEKAFDAHSVDIIANAKLYSTAAYDEWYNNYIKPMQLALQQGDLSGFGSSAGKLQGSVATMVKHDWDMTDSDYQQFVENGNKWFELRDSGASDIELAKLNAKNNKLRLKYGRDPALGEYPSFGGGGKALTDGFGYLHKEEIILPPDLSSIFERLVDNTRRGDYHSTSTSYDNRRDTKIDKVLHIEHFHNEDNTDSEILARQLGRELQKL